MSGYYERIQGTDRLLRIRRTKQIVYIVLAGLGLLTAFVRVTSAGASLKPFFLPLAGLIEIGLIMGLVGTGIGLFFKNLEIQRTPGDSQKYLMAKYSMSRASTTTGVALVVGILFLIPLTASGMAAAFTSPPQFAYLQAKGQLGAIQQYNFTSPDALGVSFVRYVHVASTGANVSVQILRNGRIVSNLGWLNGTASGDFAVEPLGWSSVADWSVVFRNEAATPASLTFTLPVGVMPELFSTVPFLLIVYGAANIGWWVGLRPIRERTRGAAVYAGVDQLTDRGESVFVASAPPTDPVGPPVSSYEPPPPPPLPEALAATIPMVAPPVPPVPSPPAALPPKEPDTPERAFARGDALIGAGAFNAAIAAYEEALRINPRFRPALMAKAAALLSLNREAEALLAFRRVLGIEPDNETALRASANILVRQTRWREALEPVESLLRKRPNDSSALELKGDLFSHLGRRPESLAAYEGAQALDPSNANLRQKIEEVRVDVPGLLSRALIASASGNYPQALNLFDDILEVEPSNVNALIGKAVAYRRSGKIQEALNCLDLVLSIQPANASALLNRGTLLAEKGDLEAAIESFDKLIGLSPSDEEAWIAQADVLVRMGRDDDAIRSFAEALKLNPGDEEVQRKIHELEASRSVSADVLQELYKVKGIGAGRAKALVDAGYRTAEDFRKATPETLAAVKGITRKIAEDLVKHFADTKLVEAR
jgi:tetratricopeptide (TPR) repeat protein